MPYANRFRFDLFQDDSEVSMLLEKRFCEPVDQEDLAFLNEPNLGCVGDYDDPQDPDSDDLLPVEWL